MSAMDRRHFIKLTAITGTSAALASCGSPENQIIRFIPEEELVPGVAEWKPSVCPLCSAGCGVIARVMDGDAEVFRNGQPGVIRTGLAKKLEGDPDAPDQPGRAVRARAGGDPGDLPPGSHRQPLKRTGERGSGQFQPISWDEAIEELVGTLDALAAAGDQTSLAFLSPAAARPPARAGRRVPAPRSARRRRWRSSSSATSVLRRANEMSFGRASAADVRSGARALRDRLRRRLPRHVEFAGGAERGLRPRCARGGPACAAKFVQVEARMSQTGANADEWVPARPGTEGVLALGLAHVIMKRGLRQPAAAGRARRARRRVAAGLPDYTPEAVEQHDRRGGRARRAAGRASSPSTARPSRSSAAGRWRTPTASFRRWRSTRSTRSSAAWTSRAACPSCRSRPPPDRPRARSATCSRRRPRPRCCCSTMRIRCSARRRRGRCARRSRKVPFIVSFGSFVDETSVLADLILPDHSFLESWVEAVPESRRDARPWRAWPGR